MPNEAYLYMVILYFFIVFARKKVDVRISLFGAFIVATLTKLDQIGNLAFFHTVMYEAIMFIISFIGMNLIYNFARMSKFVYVAEILLAIALVLIYVNLGTYIFSI